MVHKQEIVTVLKQLIRFPSRNPPGEERDCAEYIANKMEKWGFEVNLITKPFKNRPQVVAKLEGRVGESKLILNGHIDVVPEGDTSKWKMDPYKGVYRDGKIFGRGASDMKGGIATMMCCAKNLKNADKRLDGDLLLQFVVGEETGEPGTKHLLIDQGIIGDWAIVLEPTNLRVATAAKGLVWFDLKVQGKSAHASSPELGVNAIEKAMMISQALKKYGVKISEKSHKLLGRALCTITMIKGGIKENIIPDGCELVIDRRLLPDETADNAENELRNILSELHGKDLDLTYELIKKTVYESAEIPEDSYVAMILKRCIKKIMGQSPKPYGTLFSTDVRNFINDANIPAVAWGPGDPSKAHTIDESIDITQVRQATEILTLAANKLLS